MIQIGNEYINPNAVLSFTYQPKVLFYRQSDSSESEPYLDSQTPSCLKIVLNQQIRHQPTGFSFGGGNQFGQAIPIVSVKSHASVGNREVKAFGDEADKIYCQLNNTSILPNSEVKYLPSLADQEAKYKKSLYIFSLLVGTGALLVVVSIVITILKDKYIQTRSKDNQKAKIAQVSGMPQELINEYLKQKNQTFTGEQKKYLGQKYYEIATVGIDCFNTIGSTLVYECKDFQFSDYKQEKLQDTDEINNITERASFTAKYLHRSKYLDKEWSDWGKGSQNVNAKKQNGDWRIK